MSQEKFFNNIDETYYDEDSKVKEPGNTLAVAAVAGAVGLVIGSFVWNIYSDGLRAPNGELPIIGADLQAYKVAPVIANQDGIPQSDLRFLDPKLDAQDKDKIQEIDLQAISGSTLQANATTPNNVGGPPIAISQTPSSPPEYQAAPKPLPTTSAIPNAEISQNATVEPVETNIVVDVPPPIGRATALSLRTNFVTNGPYLVQLAAVRTEDAASKLWKRNKASYPELFSGGSPHIQRADLGSKGIWFRLKVDGFGSRDDAKSFCLGLKENGVDCLVTQR